MIHMKRKIDLIVLFIIISLIILYFIGSRLPKPPESPPKEKSDSFQQQENNSIKNVPQGTKNYVPAIRVPRQN